MKRRVGGGGERHQAGGTGVLLADLLQQSQRPGSHPDLVCGEKAVKLLHAERVGTDSRAVRMLVLRGTSSPARQGAAHRRELVEQPGVVAGREHERLLLVHARALKDGGRRGASLLQRFHATLCRPAEPAAELTVDQRPRVERERDRRAARRAHRLLAQRGRQARDIAEQQEDGLLA